MGRDIWAVGADLSPFSRADLGIKWHEIEHRPGSPQRPGSPRPGGENAEGAGVGGVAHATLGCFWVQMEGEWKGAEPAPPPQPLPALLSPHTSRGSARPQCQAEAWAGSLVPKDPRVGRGGQARAPFRGPLGPFCLSQLLCCHFCPVPRNGDQGEAENLPLLLLYLFLSATKVSVGELTGTWGPAGVPIV